jgi:hypothetical protein
MDGFSSYPVSNRISELPMEGANSPNILLLIANNGHHGSADPHDDHDRPSGECNNNLYESVEPPAGLYWSSGESALSSWLRWVILRVSPIDLYQSS